GGRVRTRQSANLRPARWAVGSSGSWVPLVPLSLNRPSTSTRHRGMPFSLRGGLSPGARVCQNAGRAGLCRGVTWPGTREGRFRMNRAKSSTIARVPVSRAADPAGAIHGKLLSLLQRTAPVDEFTALLGGIKELANADVPREMLAQSVEAGLALRERLVQQQQRERGLVAVIETARDLTALRDIELVLQAIVRRARELVGCTVAYLANYVPERNEFYMRATDGAMSEEMKKLKVSSDFGVIGMILRTKAPQSSSNYLEDRRIKHLEVVDEAFRREGINSILGVPLLAGDEVLGILFVADRYPRSFLPWEMSILSTLAA